MPATPQTPPPSDARTHSTTDNAPLIEVLLLAFDPSTVENAVPHVAFATLYALPHPHLLTRLEELLSSPVVGFASGFADTLALCKSPNPVWLERLEASAANAGLSTVDGGWTLCPTSIGLVAPVVFVGAYGNSSAPPPTPFAPLMGADADSFCSLSQLSLDELLAFFGVLPASVRFAPPET